MEVDKPKAKKKKKTKKKRTTCNIPAERSEKKKGNRKNKVELMRRVT